jgi:hypothetical protein
MWPSVGIVDESVIVVIVATAVDIVVIAVVSVVIDGMFG